MKKHLGLFSLLFTLAWFAPSVSRGQGWQWVKKEISGADGYVYRNLSEYPATVTGGNSFTAAIRAGKFPVQLTDPRTVPAGAKSRVSLNANLLYIETSDDVSEIMVQRTDGTKMTGKNPDQVYVESGKFYGAGSNPNAGYPKQWQFIFSPEVAGKSLKLTYKQASNNLFTYSFIAPKQAVSYLQLFGNAVSKPGSTTVTPPVTTTTVTQLTFFVVGYNCQNGALQWKFMSPSTAPVNVDWNGIYAGSITPGTVQLTNLPSDRWVGAQYEGKATQSGQGSITYVVKTSCSLEPTKPTTTTTTPPATTTTTPGSTSADASFLAYTDQDVGTIMVLENGSVRAEFDRDIGGVMSALFIKGNSNNLISTPILGTNPDGSVKKDGGQSMQFSQYETPFYEYRVNGYTRPDGTYKSPEFVTGSASTGYNPVQGGSYNGDGGKVYKWRKVTTSDRGEVVCMQVRGVLWNPHNEPGNVLMNMEYWFVPNNPKAIQYKVQEIVEDRDAAKFPDLPQYLPFRQERPTIYGTNELSRHVYRLNGNNVETQGERPYEALKERFPDDFAYSHCSNDLNRCITLVTPNQGKFVSSYIEPPHDKNKFESAPELNMDITGSRFATGIVIASSRADALSIIPTLPLQPSQDFDFDFTNEDHNWYNSRGTLKRTGSYLEFAIGTVHRDEMTGGISYDAAMRSPFRRWNASGITSVNFTGSVFNTSQLKFVWTKRNNDGTLSGYSKTFPVTGDGIERTYTVPTSDPNFNDVIIQMGIQAVDNTPSNAKIYLKRIKKGDLTVLMILLLTGGLLRDNWFGVRQNKPKQTIKIKRLVK